VDAVRAASIVPAFFLTANVLGGTDGQPRLERGMSAGSNLLGPQQSYAVDFGIDQAGNAYIRGQAASDEAPPESTAIDGQVATTMGLPTWLLLLGAAFLAYRILR